MRKSFTLIEIIFVIIILSFVLIGGFQIIGKLYLRNYLVKQTSKFEFSSQQVLDELSGILYSRIPISVIGYDPIKHDFKYIGFIEDDNNYTVLEWIGYAKDAMVDRNLSGFVDLYDSDRDSKTISCLDFNYSFVQEVINNKFKYPLTRDLNESTAIIFAGNFDRGDEEALSDYNDSFGWHGYKHEYLFTFEKNSSDGGDVNLTLNNFTHGNIYEKFYLAESAYAVALVKDLNSSLFNNCKDINLSQEDNNTLVLFYNYRPWLGQTFCADNNGTPEGNVTVLAHNVRSFKIKKVNSHLELEIELFKSKGDINISVSKQKVAF
ncbi:MAG: hypothetical protein ABGX26_05435 [Nautiliaceae bacterium]